MQAGVSAGRPHQHTQRTLRWAGSRAGWSAAAPGCRAPAASFCLAFVPSPYRALPAGARRIPLHPRDPNTPLAGGAPHRPRPAPLRPAQAWFAVFHWLARAPLLGGLGSHGGQTWARQRHHQHERQNRSPPVHPAASSGAARGLQNCSREHTHLRSPIQPAARERVRMPHAGP